MTSPTGQDQRVVFAAVRDSIDRWRDARAGLRAMEEAEHPPITDHHGRVWTWWKGTLYHHDDTLAWPAEHVLDQTHRLPPEGLRDNPNYHRLCGICTAHWSAPHPGAAPRS